MKANEQQLPFFSFSKVFSNTKKFVDLYNLTTPNLKKRLNANHRATAELVTRLYAKQLNKAIQLGDSYTNELPPFTSYNPSLASCKGCTVRTIINHKERLIASGFIIKEEHRGKSGIALWINPIIFAPLEKTKATLGSKVKKIHPLVHEQQEQNNNNNIVNNLITPNNKGVRLQAHNHPITIVTGTPQEQDKNTVESRFSDSQLQTRRKNNDAAGESESAFLLGLVKDFWQYSKATLYPEILFSKPEEIEILNLIWASIYQKFKISGSRRDWKNYQKILYQRIDMVHRWLARNTSRWLAPPHLYFSIENKRNGFNKTYHWYLKQEILKREIRNQILIQKTNQEWKDHTKGKGKHKHKTRLQLFNIQQQRFATYNDKDLMRVYHQNLERNLQL